MQNVRYTTQGKKGGGITKEPVGIDWLDSYERQEMNAFFAQNLQKPALFLSSEALKVVSHLGYGVISQIRLGKNSAPFPMVKLQTMDAPDIPHRAGVEPIIRPIARLIRNLALDELVQLLHVSTDPNKPGTMMFLGARRPQLPEEVYRRERALTYMGHKDLFKQYMEIHDKTEPAIFTPESLITRHPATLPYYKACAESVIWYYHNASKEVDLVLLTGILAAGAHILVPQL